MELLRMLALLAGSVGLLRHDLDGEEEDVDVDDNDVEEEDADVDGVAQGRHHHHRECNHHKGRGYQCPPHITSKCFILQPFSIISPFHQGCPTQ